MKRLGGREKRKEDRKEGQKEEREGERGKGGREVSRGQGEEEEEGWTYSNASGLGVTSFLFIPSDLVQKQTQKQESLKSHLKCPSGLLFN